MAATSTSTIWGLTIRLLPTRMSRAKKVGRPSGPAYGAFEGPGTTNTEFVGQTGTFADGYILAWSAATDTGYTLKQVPLQPRIGLRAGLASGDHDKHGPNLQTFSPLFPTGFYFNQAILNGPLNEMGVHPNLTLHMGERISLNGEWGWFWRQSTSDGIYGLGSNLLRPLGGQRIPTKAARLRSHLIGSSMLTRIFKSTTCTSSWAVISKTPHRSERTWTS